jgi:hypothetical protein
MTRELLDKDREEVQALACQRESNPSQEPIRAVTVEQPPVFWYDREPERRVERAFEAALPNFRRRRAEM